MRRIPVTVRDRISAFLASHDGVITTAQALACGLSRSGIQRRVTSGEWLRVTTGVFMASDHQRNARTRVRVATLSVGPAAVSGAGAAAWWHGLVDTFPSQITVFTGTWGRHPRAPAGVRIAHRTLDPVDIVEVAGLLVTGVALTVLDAAGECGPKVIDDALLLRKVKLEQLSAAHARYRSRRGASETSRRLAVLASGARSEAERVTVDLFRAGGITGWRANTEVCGHLADFVFDEKRVVVEIDGSAHHRDAKTFQRDRTKRNAWIAAGWNALNFTWDDITSRGGEVVAQVGAVVG
ncbi:DUF559 domain-containing protein [Gordonia hankookensis]|uniref:DUF559 domain-containing protein n=1 Tax=Gordonia hankookensis TaxID=589403 RepID=A0ABR7WEK0_9ACTN|nr:DUF559 domain-containing protein [Gordonia hankookensis]